MREKNGEKTLIGKAKKAKKLLILAEYELDELIEALSDPSILHAELTASKKKIEDKLDKVLDALIEIKQTQR